MNKCLPPLIFSALFLGSAGVAAQHTRTDPLPKARTGPAFVAPRLLTDLTQGPMNRGADFAGDVDNDGDVDLLALEYPNEFAPKPSAVQFWRNDGHEHFALAKTTAFGPADFPPQALADITGDGVLDLFYAFGSYSTHSALYVRPGLGDGRFGAPIHPSYFGYSCDVATGDCDGDGDLDVFFHDADSTGPVYKDALFWLRYQGGSFIPATALVLDNTYLSECATLDIDGDGKADAVSSSNSPSQLRFYRTVNNVPTAAETIPLPSALNVYRRLQTGDLDGDGDDDVLVVADESDTFVFLPVLNTPGGFVLGALQSLPNYLFDAEPPFLRRDGELVDWDGDGDVDYVSPTLAWAENTGGGTFVRQGQVNLHGYSGGYGTKVLVTDLDSDGHLDALARWTCFLGDGSFPTRISNPHGFDPSSLSRWTSLEDWDGDGDLDLVGSMSVYVNKGDGSFENHSSAVGGPFFDRGWGDFDGDGFRDRVTAVENYPGLFENMALFRGTETGAYESSQVVPSPVEMSSGLAGDIDGDGDIDLLSANGFWSNDGSAHFGSATIPAYAGQPLLALDLDRDGALDLFVDHGGTLEWLRNLGSLSFQVASLGIPAPASSQLSAADVDGDGDLDLAVTRPASNTLILFRQLPGGVLAAPFTLAVPGADGPVGLIDVDGDGRRDVVVGGSFDGFGVFDSYPLPILSAWIRGPGLGYTERRDWVLLDKPLGFGDMDRDGDVDVVGDSLFTNLRFDGPTDGTALQYGLDAATSGTGGIHPVLGSGRAARPGRLGQLVVGRGLGGAAGVLVVGDARDNVLAGGYRSLVSSPTTVRSFVLGGPAGVPGKGSLALPLQVIPALIGLTRDFQVVLIDPGSSSGLSATNGLEIHFGQ